MNETLEVVDTIETIESTENITENQKQALELIKSSTIPDVLKDHFSDMIRLLGKDTAIENKASQIINIADELQLAKRIYLENNKLENDSAVDLLVHEIMRIYY